MKQKQTSYLTAGAIYRYLTGKDDKVDTLILCHSANIHLITTDQSLYEALGSIQDRQSINYNKLVKLLEVTEIRPYEETMKSPRKILREDRVTEIIEGVGDNQ